MEEQTNAGAARTANERTEHQLYYVLHLAESGKHKGRIRKSPNSCPMLCSEPAYKIMRF